MNTLKMTAAGTALGGALLVGGGLSLAQAAPQAQGITGDGAVNVTVSANGQQVGILQDVSLANAAALAGTVCPAAVIDNAALTRLDTDGTKPADSCANSTGLTFTFAQNSPGASESAPGQDREAPTTVTTQPNAIGQQGR